MQFTTKKPHKYNCSSCGYQAVAYNDVDTLAGICPKCSRTDGAIKTRTFVRSDTWERGLAVGIKLPERLQKIMKALGVPK